MRTLGYIICDIIYAPFSNTSRNLAFSNFLVAFRALFSLFVFRALRAVLLGQ